MIEPRMVLHVIGWLCRRGWAHLGSIPGGTLCVFMNSVIHNFNVEINIPPHTVRALAQVLFRPGSGVRLPGGHRSFDCGQWRAA